MKISNLQNKLNEYKKKVKKPFSQVPKQSHSIFKGLNKNERNVMKRLITLDNAKEDMKELEKAFDNLPSHLRKGIENEMDKCEKEINTINEELGLNSLKSPSFDHMISKEENDKNELIRNFNNKNTPENFNMLINEYIKNGTNTGYKKSLKIIQESINNPNIDNSVKKSIISMNCYDLIKSLKTSND